MTVSFRSDELLHEISEQFPTSAVQVNAIAMKTPAIESSNLIMTFVQDELPEYITIERQKIEASESATRGREDKIAQALVERKIARLFLVRDVLDDGAVRLKVVLQEIWMEQGNRERFFFIQLKQRLQRGRR